MRITPEQKAQIQRIISTLDCPQKCPCHTCDFQTRGQIEPIGDTGSLACLEDRGRYCPYGLSFGGRILCQCPLRKYLADHERG